MRQEVYRVAYDEANAELSEILSKFEQLRLRKDRIEKVVEALKPLALVEDGQTSVSDRSAALPERTSATADPNSAFPGAEPIQTVPGPLSYPVQQNADQASDPFTRRIESAVGASSATREVREYSRLFNTGSSRGN